MATNDIWRLSVVGSHSGTEIAVCTFHFRFKSNVATFDGAAALLKTNVIDLVAAKQTSTFRWDKIVGLKINPLPKQSGEYTTGFPIAGAMPELELPHQSAIVVSTKTMFAGRRYRGRHYLPAPNQAELTGAQWNATTVNALQGYYDDFVANAGAEGASQDYEWVVWSEANGNSNAITQVIVRNNPGVIRRRRIGVGQ